MHFIIFDQNWNYALGLGNYLYLTFKHLNCENWKNKKNKYIQKLEWMLFKYIVRETINCDRVFLKQVISYYIQDKK